MNKIKIKKKKNQLGTTGKGREREVGEKFLREKDRLPQGMPQVYRPSVPC
jgi:hypothetical protein